MMCVAVRQDIAFGVYASAGLSSIRCRTAPAGANRAQLYTYPS